MGRHIPSKMYVGLYRITGKAHEIKHVADAFWHRTHASYALGSGSVTLSVQNSFEGYQLSEVLDEAVNQMGMESLRWSVIGPPSMI
jgi:hypothetical protein